MPTYRNTALTSKFFPDYGMVEAGGYVTSTKYPYPLDAAFELTEYGDSPWVKFHAAALPATLTGLTKYGQVIIVNDTGDSVSLEANEDAANPMIIFDGYSYPITQENEPEKLEITGSGAGNVYVYGLE